ncbi:MAG: ElyC/SanA/YdcF family protein, partial [Verrucomicrobiota bacterium]
MLWLVVLSICAVGYTYLTASWAARGRLFDRVAELPATRVGLVFGTTDRVNGRENPYFRYRIDAAVRVWRSGKLKALIVSGDNRSRYYNEPDKMKQALIERGIPRNRIICDYAGLRTLDSVVRAKEVFGANSVLFISQCFQNQRAIYLAQAYHLDAYGFNARDLEPPAGLKTRLREVGARVKMWLDV